MRRAVLIVCILVLVLSLTRAEQSVKGQKSDVTKLGAADLGDAEVEFDPGRSDVQRKRDSGYPYGKPTNRVPPSTRLRSQASGQPGGQIASRIVVQLSRPFTRYGLPTDHSISSASSHGYRAQHHRDKLQQQQQQQQQQREQSSGFDSEFTQQEVPSPIRNVDFAEANPIASQNNEPFGMHTANYLPPQNQKLPAYSPTDGLAPAAQLYSSQTTAGVAGHGASAPSLLQSQPNQISDAALFLAENAQAIQQLYGAPASDQDFAPAYDQFQDAAGPTRGGPSGQFGDLESASRSPQEFHLGVSPPYASGTPGPRETLAQIQSLEKDRLIAQLQRALIRATEVAPNIEATIGDYRDQTSFVRNRELLASISRQRATPQTVAFGNAAFGQSPFSSGTTVNPSGFPLNYGIPTTTAQTPPPTTTTTTATTTLVTAMAATPSFRPPQSSGGTVQVVSPPPVAPNQPGSSAAAASPAGIPLYGGFVPTYVTGANFVPSYSTGVFGASAPIGGSQAQPSGSSPTHFGIPIPTEWPAKPAPGVAPSFPTVTPTSRPGVALAPALAPVVLPIQPIRPVAAPLHPVATPVVQPVAVAPSYPTQGAASSAVTTDVLQTALINPLLYKPIKAIYPVYYYPNVAYQLQKPALPSHPWSDAPSYAQAKPAQIWK